MEKKTWISVIIPVYNVEKYLEECINSVLAQKCQCCEVILVDDGSTDGSGKICDQYAKQNGCVKAIHKQNGGLSDARNRGLEAASGTYVIFLDSDDYWADQTFLQNIQSEINKSEPDLIVFGYCKLYENGTRQTYIPKGKSREIVDLLEQDDFNICAWDKAIKKSILTENRIYFRKNVFSEDMEWCAKLFQYADSCSVLPSASYMYRQRAGSITKKITDKNIEDVMNNYQRCLKVQTDMGKRKQEKFNLYLSKNLSMFMIALSQLEYRDQKKYYLFVRQNLDILRSHTRNREKYLYLASRLMGVKRTEKLLGKIYRMKQMNALSGTIGKDTGRGRRQK